MSECVCGCGRNWQKDPSTKLYISGIIILAVGLYKNVNITYEIGEFYNLFGVHDFAFVNLEVAHGNGGVEGRAEGLRQLILGQVLLGDLSLALLMLPLDLIK